jgi:hypothetical protein
MTVALAVVALVHDAMWFWGLNQARFVPMVIALAAAVSSIGLAVAVVYSTPHIALSSLPPAVRWLLLGTLAGAMSFGLLAASDNLWFLGDFYFRMSAISSGQFVSAIPQAFPLERLLSGVIPDYLRLQTPDATLQYLRWKGAVIAGAYVLLAARLGAVLARQSWLVFAWIVVMNGMLCFFTGHPRPVAEMLVTGLATIVSGVEVLLFKRRHWALALSMILLLLVHRSGLAFLPAYAYVMWTAWRSVTLSTSQRVALWLPIVIAVMLIPKALEVATTFDLVRHVTSVGSGGVGGPHHGEHRTSASRGCRERWTGHGAAGVAGLPHLWGWRPQSECACIAISASACRHHSAVGACSASSAGHVSRLRRAGAPWAHAGSGVGCCARDGRGGAERAASNACRILCVEWMARSHSVGGES